MYDLFMEISKILGGIRKWQDCFYLVTIWKIQKL
jgi:hypothetical protein